MQTPPARSDPALSHVPPAVPRLALEHLPLPVLVFEPSHRLNFVNIAARHFFGLAAHLKKPEADFLGADELFGDDIKLSAPSSQDKEAMLANGETIEFGDWGEQLRTFSCKRRTDPSLTSDASATYTSLVRGSVTAFTPTRDYFSAGIQHATTNPPLPPRHRPKQGSKSVLESPSPLSPSLEHGSWHIVTLLTEISTPLSSGTLHVNSPRLSAKALSPRKQPSSSAKGQASTSASGSGDLPFAEFSAFADSRPPTVLMPQTTSTFSTKSSAASPAASLVALAPASPRSAIEPVPTGSFFPAPGTSSASSIASVSTRAGTSSSYSASTSVSTPASQASSNTSLQSSIRSRSSGSIPQLPHYSPAMSETEERPAPPPRQDSPAALIIAKQRAQEMSRPSPASPFDSGSSTPLREGAPRPPARPKFTQSRSSYTSAKGSKWSSPQSSSSSATIGHPGGQQSPGETPSHGSMPSSTNPLTLLTHCALAHVPRTGFILASSDLSGGFVNDTARELLLGVHRAKGKKTAEKTDSDSESDAEDSETAGGDWMEDGMWIAMPEPGGKWTWDGAEFFRGIQNESHYKTGKAKPTHSSPSSGTGRQSSTDSGNLPEPSIGLPQQMYKMTVSTILQRSQSLAKAKRRQAAAAKLGNHPIPNVDQSTSKLPTVNEELSSPVDKPKPKLAKKAYKVYDASFSQRILDPLEPLLELVARKGQEPDASLGGGVDAGGIIIGIEVELTSSSSANLEGFVTTRTLPGVSASEVQDPKLQQRSLRRRLVEVRASPIRKPDGTHLGGMLILRDVTDERRSSSIESQALRLRELTGKKSLDSGQEYFKQILDHMPQMVWTTTPMGSHDYFNNQWYEYTGLEPEQSLGLGWQNPFHDDDMPHAIKAWSHSLATGDPYSVEYRCRRHDGKWRWMLGRALPLRDATGAISGWFGTCTDVEDSVASRQELWTTQEQFNSVLHNSDMLICCIDMKKRISFLKGFKEEFIPHSNMTTAEAIGKYYFDVFPRNDLESTDKSADHLNGLFDQILSGTEAQFAQEVPYFDGSPWHMTVNPYRTENPDGSTSIIGAIIVGRDVSLLRNAQLELAKVNDERSRLLVSEAAAKEASRLKSEFVSTMNHELRTPVSGMIGIAELLLDDATLTGSQRDSIEKIMRSGEILLDMIGMVLDMGKVEAGKLDLERRPFKLDSVFSDARLVAFGAERKGLKFVDKVGQVYSGPVLGDMPKLRQILTNILSNAIKFTSAGSITLIVKQEEENDTHVLISFSVEDTGVGIKASNLPHLFQAFQQEDVSTARKFGGTGLGLYISKQLAELMGGSIALTSDYGNGTCAACTIPFEKAPLTVQLPPEEAPRLREIDRSSVWILVAEDNDINRQVVVRHLQKMHFNVKAVINGVEALEALRERTYDLILMDGQMPELDGYNATRAIRANPEYNHQTVKIVALTAAAVQGDRQRCLEAGMDDYLSKPVRAKSLEEMILRQLVPSPRRSPTSSETDMIDPSTITQ